MSPGLGLIHGTTGCMGSGKTSQLIGALSHPHVHEDGVILFQPPTASRAGATLVRSRIHAAFKGAVAVDHPRKILRLVTPEIKHVGIEEIQFYGRTSQMIDDFKRVILTLRDRGHYIYWTGLPVDFRREPFEPVPWMMAESDVLNALQVRCARCRQIPAHFPQRLIFGHPAPRNHPLFVPDTDTYREQGISYEARCGNCHELPDHPNPDLRAILRAIRNSKHPRRHH